MLNTDIDEIMITHAVAIYSAGQRTMHLLKSVDESRSFPRGGSLPIRHRRSTGHKFPVPQDGSVKSRRRRPPRRCRPYERSCLLRKGGKGIGTSTGVVS